MPATRPRASFEPIPPDFDLKSLVESTPNFSYVDRISCDMIDQQGMPAFEKLILLHVIIGGKPLVIDGFEDRLDPWTFTPKWLRDNCGDKHENARNLTAKDYIPLTMAHYLENMDMLTKQFFSKPGAYREQKRQRVYLKDIDCPPVWQDKLREHIPSMLYYLNESTGDVGGPGAVPDPTSNVSGRRLGKGIARAGDLMSSLPPDMRAENLMCYVGHEGTYTPSHREMCATLGHNIMVEASNTVSDDGKAEKPGSSIWFMTESKDRHMVSEYWLSVLGHDIEVENHFAQVVAWKKAPFNVYVVEQRPGDFILIPPLAPHQVWNRGTRTMKVAWNRTTVETLEIALNEALPRSRIVCRDEQYKNKAIIYYTLQKYSSLLTLAQTQASRMPNQEAAHQLLTSPKIKQLAKDFRRLFSLYRQVLLSEMFNPEEPPPKQIEYIPFDSNVTCAYCRSNIFNRFLTCPSCKDILGHHNADSEGDPYDICMDCYAMGRSCACISGHKWVEQFRWKELAAKYETWRKLIVALDGGQITEKTPLPILEERKRYGKKTLAEVCKEQLKRRPWKDVHKSTNEPKSEDEEEEEEIVVDDNGVVKKIQKKRSKAWLKNNSPCHVCCHRHPNWKMAQCSGCERWWCYGTLFRGWDKMPSQIMEDENWTCPHCLGICFAGACKREGKMKPYEPKGTLLGHDTKKVADARSVEALVDFSVSNLNWLKEDDPSNRAESKRLKRAAIEAQKHKEMDPTLEAEDEEAEGVEESRVEFEDVDVTTPPIDPALGGNGYGDDDDAFARRLQQAAISSSAQPSRAPQAAMGSGAPDGYAPVSHAGYVPPAANMYPQPEDAAGGYSYPSYARPSSVEPMNGRDGSEDVVGDLRPFKRRRREDDDHPEGEDITMTKAPKAKKPRMSAAGFRSSDLADGIAPSSTSKAKNEAQRQFEKEKERKALERAKSEGSRLAQVLAQVLAQQAAKAALTAGEEADAEHEVEEGAAQPNDRANGADEGDEGEDGVVLKSDIAPKKKANPSAYYQQRQREGHLINGRTQKALIPVEKDDNYGYSAPKKNRSDAPEKSLRPKKRKSAATVTYEEVDIGSDDDAARETVVVSGAGGAVGGAKERRSLPGYLQSRHGEEDQEFPDELPADFRDGAHKARQLATAALQRNADGSFVPKAKAKPATAGKRPSMRPSLGGTDAEAIYLDEDTQKAIDAAANGDFMDVDEVMAAAPAPTFAAINRAAPVSKPRASPAVQKQKAMDEQNRLAKLQAFEAMTAEDQSPATKQKRKRNTLVMKSGVSMADALDDGSEDDDDDGVEDVPARRGLLEGVDVVA
ncbi:hypothetical protein LTR37_007963 [Vermiconidia calcicola]|uniref:Uncharacterized protein n=1 Tax=Vermiconidia calcicola TaxID=1690605 RepID=A0ACC3NDG3_9PEZI|nr:hypothetical protein LTR37_007963 [Vermiconidia calcicola]